MKKLLSDNQKAIIISLALFGIAYFVKNWWGLLPPLYIFGFFLAIFVPGMAIKILIDPDEDWLANVVTAPIFTVFIFVPVVYWLLSAFHLTINFEVLSLSIILLSVVFIIFSRSKVNDRLDGNERRYIIFGIIFFVVVHFLTTLVYRYIPEVDGYTYLRQIENIISEGVIRETLRPVFLFFSSYVSIISHISPYWLFKYGLILIQIPGVYYFYQIIKTAGVKLTLARYVALLVLVSVPVINLEIDYVRPNVYFLLGVIPFIYYMALGLDGKKRNFLFSLFIAASGILYHEFYVILLLIGLGFCAIYFFNKLNNFNKFLSVVSSLIMFLVVLLNIKRLPVIYYLLLGAKSFIELLINGVQWKWWYLSGYSNLDGLNVGWNSFGDVLKYYAYSLSPFLFVTILVSVGLLLKRLKLNEKIHNLEIVAYVVLLTGLIFVEFLPRINFKTLPDRFWPFIVYGAMVLVPFVFAKIKIFEKKTVIVLVLVMLLIGIGGSVYVADIKGGYISESEYKASKWISQNTPDDSVFITQIGNGVMLSYFAHRSMVVPYAAFFVNTNDNQVEKEKKESDLVYTRLEQQFKESVKNPKDEVINSLVKNIKEYNMTVENIRQKENLINPVYVLPKRNNVYVLYSKDKFGGYYINRSWWKDMNFYGADLSKFSQGYELVYNDNDLVYIWRKL